MELGYKAFLTKGTPKQIHVCCVIATPEGIAHLQKHLPENCHLWIATLDEGLDSKNYIVPGLGDAGDRLFGTK